MVEEEDGESHPVMVLPSNPYLMFMTMPTNYIKLVEVMNLALGTESFLLLWMVMLL